MSTPERQQDDDGEKLGGYGGTHVDPEDSEPVAPSSTPGDSAPDAVPDESGVDYPMHPDGHKARAEGD